MNNYIKSPFNYTGSKFKILKSIIPHFSKTERFIDSFCGGGSVFTNVLYGKILANDKIPSLVEFYRELQTKSWEYIQSEISLRMISKDYQEDYIKLRERYNKDYNPYDFFMLVCTCTNNMIRFNKKFQFNQTWGKRTYNNSTVEKLYGYWEKINGNNSIEFYNEEFYNLPVNSNDFVYLDPPYMITEAGYNAFWSNELETKLYDYMDYLDEENIKFAMSNVKIHKGLSNEFLSRLSKWNIIEIDHNYDKVSRLDDDSNTVEILIVN